MRKKRPFIASVTGVLCIYLLLAGCQKIVHGYISDDIFYQVNPFYVAQGGTTVSAALVGNGSTAPLHVTVLALKDSAGNDMDSVLTTPRSIVTFTGAITYADSTLDLLKTKLKDSLVRPFNIAETGGRLQFTAATSFVPAGTYYMDLQVSNTRGTRTLNNACTIIIQPTGDTYSLAYRRLGVYDATGTTLVSNFDNDDNYCSVEVTHVSSTPVSQVIYKWVDKNGVVFSPAKGEVVAFSKSYPTLHNWIPYYQEVYGDSTITEQIPDYGIMVPYFQTAKVPDGTLFTNGGQNCRVDYRINNTDSKDNAVYKSMTAISYLSTGTYYITVHMNSLVHKS